MIAAAAFLFGVLLTGVGWKRYASRAEKRTKAAQQALFAVRFEAGNAVNAIRSNLMVFRDANPAPSAPEHLELIEHALQRIGKAVEAK